MKITKPLSADNAALLLWKLGRPMTPGLKITLTAEELGSLLDAARVDEQAAILDRQLEALTNVLRAENAMAEGAEQAKH